LFIEINPFQESVFIDEFIMVMPEAGRVPERCETKGRDS
jgi:hypothetical protein